jgi:hypothetical protein
MPKDRKRGIIYTRNSKCRMSGNMAGWPWVGMIERELEKDRSNDRVFYLV